MKRSGHTPLTVPVHHGKDLATGTLREIIRKSGFSVEMFKAEL
jgi:predicted RNA binding protein YcfA (HicA-like mRNA interferase family)